MRWRGRNQPDELPPSIDRLIAETEAYLSGRYLEQRQSAAATPAWAYLNALAHTPPERIGEPTMLVTASAPTGSWGWAMEAVATELLAWSEGRPDRIGELQRHCLVPLELTLMRSSFRHVLPVEVVALAAARLRAHPTVGEGGRLHVPPSDEQ